MKNGSNIVDDAHLYVRNLFLEQLPPNYLFHNYNYAKEIVSVCKNLAKGAKLSDEQAEILFLAAWFQYTGYVQNREDYLSKSISLAREFLGGKKYDEKRIQSVEKLIKSSHPDQVPASIPEKILHDAQWSYLGRKRFFRRSKLLKLEKEQVEEKSLTLHEWNKYLLDLQVKTKFLTPWANENYGAQKNKNIALQRENVTKAREKTIRKRTGKDFGRGIDTIYRITLRNHIDLSSIADGKANMIININTIAISILITVGSAGFSMSDINVNENLHFVVPIIVLMVSSLSAIIFGILSAIPKVSGDNFQENIPVDAPKSLMYFGNFLQMEKEDFVKYLRELKKDQEALYDDLSRDLYNLGLVLQRKYKLLSIAYRIFMGGLILTVLSFVAIYLFYL